MTGPVRHYSAARGIFALRRFADGAHGTVQLADALNIGERAARGLINRLEADGFIKPIPDTRHLRYELADGSYRLGLALLTAGIDAGTARQRRDAQPVTVGDCLRAFRRTRGIAQEAFADMIGLDRRVLQDVELGQQELSFEALTGIARRLGVSPLEIVLAPR